MCCALIVKYTMLLLKSKVILIRPIYYPRCWIISFTFNTMMKVDLNALLTILVHILHFDSDLWFEISPIVTCHVFPTV
jgi:hypothetical protein